MKVLITFIITFDYVVRVSAFRGLSNNFIIIIVVEDGEAAQIVVRNEWVIAWKVCADETLEIFKDKSGCAYLMLLIPIITGWIQFGV